MMPGMRGQRTERRAMGDDALTEDVDERRVEGDRANDSYGDETDRQAEAISSTSMIQALSTHIASDTITNTYRGIMAK